MTFTGVLGYPAGPAAEVVTAVPRYGYCGTAFGNNGAAATVASGGNHANVARMFIGEPIVAERVLFRLNVSSGSMHVSIYTSTGSGSAARPHQLVTTTGVVAAPSTGSYVSTELLRRAVVRPGMWVVTQIDNATATVFTATHTAASVGTWDWNPGALTIVESFDGLSLSGDSRVFHIMVEGRPL